METSVFKKTPEAESPSHLLQLLIVSGLRLILHGCLDKPGKQRMAIPGGGGKLRMELHAYKPGMVSHLHDLHQLSVCGKTSNLKASGFQVR